MTTCCHRSALVLRCLAPLLLAGCPKKAPVTDTSTRFKLIPAQTIALGILAHGDAFKRLIETAPLDEEAAEKVRRQLGMRPSTLEGSTFFAFTTKDGYGVEIGAFIPRRIRGLPDLVNPTPAGRHGAIEIHRLGARATAAFFDFVTFYGSDRTVRAALDVYSRKAPPLSAERREAFQAAMTALGEMPVRLAALLTSGMLDWLRAAAAGLASKLELARAFGAGIDVQGQGAVLRLAAVGPAPAMEALAAEMRTLLRTLRERLAESALFRALTSILASIVVSARGEQATAEARVPKELVGLLLGTLVQRMGGDLLPAPGG